MYIYTLDRCTLTYVAFFINPLWATHQGTNTCSASGETYYFFCSAMQWGETLLIVWYRWGSGGRQCSLCGVSGGDPAHCVVSVGGTLLIVWCQWGRPCSFCDVSGGDPAHCVVLVGETLLILRCKWGETLSCCGRDLALSVVPVGVIL